MNSSPRRASTLIVTSLVIALAVPVSVNAAAARLIMFYDGLLASPIVLDDWTENLLFMAESDAPISVPEEELKGRPSTEVAFFWGPRWVQYIAEGKPLDKLDPKEAEQHGRYYPATQGGETAVIVMDRLPAFLANQTRQRQISSVAVDILKRHGVPVVVQRRPLVL